jgi:diamine N-acetyltransferase
MKVGKANKDECDIYIKLRKEYMADTNKREKINLTKTDSEIKKEFLTPVNNKNNNIYSIEYNGEVIGYINFNLFKNNGKKTLYINDIFISKNFRGKGHGKLSMEWIIDFSKNKKCNRIGLGAGAKNKRAQKMYEKIGFKIVGVNYGMDLK